jgi:hypothetical protein
VVGSTPGLPDRPTTALASLVGIAFLPETLDRGAEATEPVAGGAAAAR